MPITKEAIAPWEQQPGESFKAFEAFSIYRDMGAERSILKVSARLSKTDALIKRWSRQWMWVERARAYDRELDRKAREQAIKDVRNMTNRHIRIAMQLQERAVNALKDLPSEKLTPKMMLEFLDKATKLERSNRLSEAGFNERGLPAPNTAAAQPEPEDNPDDGLDINAIRKKMDEMTDEQLAQYEALCDMFRDSKR